MALCLVVFLGMAALAIDLGSLDQARAQAQSAADAGALAASQDLPSSTGAAAADATTYALKNYPTATVTTATNYGGSANQIQVKVSATRATWFASIFGISSANVSATAVAGGYGKSQQAAIFAYSDGGTTASCSSDTGISIPMNNAQITGGIQSNGDLTATGKGTTTLASGVYGTASGCSCNCTASFTTAPFQSAPTSYPLDYRTNPPTCTDYVTVTMNNAATGFIEANNVNILKSNFTITGDGPVVAGTGDGLSG